MSHFTTQVYSRETQLCTIEKKPATQNREAEKHSQQSNRRHALNLHTATYDNIGTLPRSLVASSSAHCFAELLTLLIVTTESGRAKPANAAKANVLQSWAHVRVDETANI
jgi:hypothetical protein